MALLKIGRRKQITLPDEVLEEMHVSPGDFVEVDVNNGRLIGVPKQAVTAAPAPKLSAQDQELATSAAAKIKAINDDAANSVGLSEVEADIAAKVGLIDPDQRYYWLESFQEGMRESEREVREGKAESFDSAEDLIAALNSSDAG